jgi:hypothetical protein
LNELEETPVMVERPSSAGRPRFVVVEFVTIFENEAISNEGSLEHAGTNDKNAGQRDGGDKFLIENRVLNQLVHGRMAMKPTRDGATTFKAQCKVGGRRRYDAGRTRQDSWREDASRQES